jgi:DNA integrity scanning protein DisA with diadenylate cyclase activity
MVYYGGGVGKMVDKVYMLVHCGVWMVYIKQGFGVQQIAVQILKFKSYMHMKFVYHFLSEAKRVLTSCMRYRSTTQSTRKKSLHL